MNERQARGWVSDLPLTPLQSDHDHIFNHKFHTGVTISGHICDFTDYISPVEKLIIESSVEKLIIES